MNNDIIKALESLDPNGSLYDLEDPFVQVWNSFWTNKSYTLHEKAVWITLKTFARSQKSCFPSHKTIAEATGVSRSTVIRALEGLVEKGGVIVVQQQTEKKSLTSNLYYLAKVNSTTGEFIPESLKTAMLAKELVAERLPKIKKNSKGGRPKKDAKKAPAGTSAQESI